MYVYNRIAYKIFYILNQLNWWTAHIQWPLSFQINHLYHLRIDFAHSTIMFAFLLIYTTSISHTYRAKYGALTHIPRDRDVQTIETFQRC